MPGVLIMEALAQACGILTLESRGVPLNAETPAEVDGCDVYVAILDAFADARRQLDGLSRSRGEAPLMGNFPDDD